MYIFTHTHTQYIYVYTYIYILNKKICYALFADKKIGSLMACLWALLLQPRCATMELVKADQTIAQQRQKRRRPPPTDGGGVTGAKYACTLTLGKYVCKTK